MPLAKGPIKLTVTLDAARMRAVARGLDRAVAAESERLVGRLSEMGVRFMAGLERGLGHDVLAGLWSHTPPRPEGPDAYAAEVYSRAEERTFYNRDGGRDGPRRAEYPVDGEDLVRWLEYGVAAHEILPRDPAGALAWAGRPGESASDFVGTAMTEGGVVAGSFVNDGQDTDDIVTGAVSHPGFAGNHNLRATRSMIEAALRREGPLAARRVAVTFANFVR